METRLLFLISFFLLGVPTMRSSDPLLSPKGVNFEVAALMAVKGRMKDDTGAMNGWDINSVDPCTWSMVACSPDGLVISLEMANNGLSGTLSPSIGNLSHLQTMLLQNNKISGSIPLEIGKLSELMTLDLSGNQLSGEIPKSLGHLAQLNYLRLNRNNLSSQIPEAVASLAGLMFLDLSFNNLSSPTPKILAKDYSLAGNRFLCNSSLSHSCVDVTLPVHEANTSRHGNNHVSVVIIPLIVGCTSIVAMLLIIYGLRYSRWHLSFASDERVYELEMGHLKRFSFRELQIGTDNFNSRNILGQGGFGIIYRCCLKNGTTVAVKRLKDPNFTGQVQFQTEVEMIGLALHRNLLRLLGFCMTSNERLLVYPYMPNGSVADRLRVYSHGPSLDWNRRLRIALGAARGLFYLHELCNPKIIHRDVKAANILLDETFEAVVGDFGLAKLLDQRESHVTTAVRGTVGHIAPEYLSTGQSSEKTDVYGFGILLLELITGQKTLISLNGTLHRGSFLDMVRSLQEENELFDIVDKDIRGSILETQLESIVKLVLLCTQPNPSLRPKMSEVVKELESIVLPAEQTEESARGTVCGSSNHWRSNNDSNEASSFIIEAIELSGPR